MASSLLCLFLIVAVLTVTAEPPPAPLVGQISYYNPGVMQRPCAYWTELKVIEPCPNCIGMVALHVRYVKWRGEQVWLQRPGLASEGPFQVVDFGRFLTPGRIAEVDWETSRRWEMAGPIEDVRLYFEEPDDGQWRSPSRW